MNDNTNTAIENTEKKEGQWLKEKLVEQVEMLSINSTRHMMYNELANLSNAMAAIGELLFSMQRPPTKQQCFHKELCEKQHKEREQTKEAHSPMKTVTTDFDKIVLTEIFPLIPKAFQTLAVELSGANLRPQSGIEADIVLKQASILKEKISHYIDRQADASIQIFKEQESGKRRSSND